MKQEVLHMKDLLKGVQNMPTDNSSETDEIEEFIEDVVGAEKEEDTSLPINYMNVEQIIIPEITDSQGRLSDIVESFEVTTGLSVIPLDMTDVAPEVSQLKRHSIFTIDDKRFAMSNKIREDVVQKYIEDITSMLKTGLPFIKSLSVTIPFDGKDYKSYALSQKEWTYLISVFNAYHGGVYLHGDDLVLKVTPKRRK